MSRMEENRAKDPSYHANCQSKSLWKPVVPHLPTLGDVSNACQTETCIVAKAQSPNGAGKNIISQHAVGRSSPIRFVQVGGCIAGITTTSGADTCTTNTTASSTRNAAASQVQTTGSRITKENTARCQAKPLAKGESFVAAPFDVSGMSMPMHCCDNTNVVEGSGILRCQYL